MANRDGGVGVQQQERHGFADNVAAAEDHGIRAFNGNLVAAKYFHAPGGSAGDEAGPVAHQHAHADGMEAIDVFRRIHGFEHAFRIDL